MNNLGVKNIQLKGFSPVPWNSVFNRFLLEKNTTKIPEKVFFIGSHDSATHVLLKRFAIIMKNNLAVFFSFYLLLIANPWLITS